MEIGLVAQDVVAQLSVTGTGESFAKEDAGVFVYHRV